MKSTAEIEEHLRARYHQPSGVEQFGIEAIPSHLKTVRWFDLFSIIFNFLVNPGVILGPDGSGVRLVVLAGYYRRDQWRGPVLRCLHHYGNRWGGLWDPGTTHGLSPGRNSPVRHIQNHGPPLRFVSAIGLTGLLLASHSAGCRQSR